MFVWGVFWFTGEDSKGKKSDNPQSGTWIRLGQFWVCMPLLQEFWCASIPVWLVWSYRGNEKIKSIVREIWDKPALRDKKKLFFSPLDWPLHYPNWLLMSVICDWIRIGLYEIRINHGIILMLMYSYSFKLWLKIKSRANGDTWCMMSKGNEYTNVILR